MLVNYCVGVCVVNQNLISSCRVAVQALDVRIIHASVQEAVPQGFYAVDSAVPQQQLVADVQVTGVYPLPWRGRARRHRRQVLTPRTP
jgi:hypothetical protein